MSTTYLESAEGVTITQERAMIELENHGLHGNEYIKDFLSKFGKKDKYSANELLEWLGY